MHALYYMRYQTPMRVHGKRSACGAPRACARTKACGVHGHARFPTVWGEALWPLLSPCQAPRVEDTAAHGGSAPAVCQVLAGGGRPPGRHLFLPAYPCTTLQAGSTWDLAGAARHAASQFRVLAKYLNKQKVKMEVLQPW